MKIIKLSLLLLLICRGASAQYGNNPLVSEVIETWKIHSSMNKKLLDGVNPENLKDHSCSEGRNVAEQFAHLHNVRVQWLNEITPESKTKLSEIGKDDALNKELLAKSLEESAQLVNKVLSEALTGDKKVSWPMSPVVFMGYLISHESHQRGQIILSLKQAGHPVGPNIAYGIWNWRPQ
ncbi:MAG: DinB family protein [Cyclobacteriaceae bacterium]